MTVEKEILKDWFKLFEHGDVTAISKLIGKSISTAGRILDGTRNPTVDDFEIITKYFAPRKQKLEKLTLKK